MANSSAEQLLLAAALLRENCPSVSIVEVRVAHGQLLPLTAFLHQMTMSAGPLPEQTPDWLDINGVRFKEAPRSVK